MIKKISIVFGALWILLLTAWIALSVLLIFKADDIGRYLISYVNKIQEGELRAEKVNISSIRQFPHISVILSNVTYYESKGGNEKPIAKINDFYCGFELLKLMKSEIKITKIKIDGGHLDLIIYPDSTVNLMNAIKLKSVSRIDKKSSKSELKPDSSDISLVIDELDIDKLKFNITNNPENKESAFFINEFNSDFEYRDGRINLNFNTTLNIEKLKLNNDHHINNLGINLAVQSILDNTEGLQIKKGTLDTDVASFIFSGHFNPSNDGDLSLQIESDGSLSILSLFVREQVAKNLTKGEFLLKGFIDGKIFSEFPLIDAQFGFIDIELTNPVTKGQISNLNLKGSFNSGRDKSFSKAFLDIDTLYANIANGVLNFSGRIEDFSHPKFNINLFLNADVTGADDIFKLTGIDSIKGSLTLKGKIVGEYESETKTLKNNADSLEIVFDNFGFIIPDAIKFDNINGTILRNDDVITFKDLLIKSDETDFNINGDVRNLQYLLFNIEKEITANLSIKSKVFDLPNFLSFDPSIKRDFPHRILDLDLIVNAFTTTSKALHFKSFPEILFEIKKLDATAEGFIPEIKIESGKFKVSENVLGFHMDFNEFKTEFLDGGFNFSAQYNSSSYQPFYIKGNFEMDEVKISKLFFDDKDSIPEFIDSETSGTFNLELQFADDSTQIKIFNLTNGNLTYAFSKDTICTTALNLRSAGIDYRLKENSNPLATLTASGNLKANKIQSPLFNIENFDFSFSVINGSYRVESKRPKLFGNDAKGTIVYDLKPFLEKPQFRIYCDISSFNIQEMLRTFLNDTTVAGNLSMSMDISAEGKELEEMVKSMNGNIKLNGKNLIFYGVDADKIIEEFQRTQNFNLVDAGAVLLAGPVGLVVTKGTDFAKILITSPGKSSLIKQFVSNWKIAEGSFLAEDVALSTSKNKVAAKGWINIATDSLNISFAVINNKGCSIFRQDVFGDLNKPTLGKVKIVSTLLAPVTNLYNDIMDVNCQVFYDGSLIKK